MSNTKKVCQELENNEMLNTNDFGGKDSEEIGLKREINLLYLVCIITGITVGSGIFVSPVSITYNCGSIALSLIVWGLSGILMMMAALSYVDMALTCGSAGGEFTYYKATIGDLPAFLYAWFMFLLINPAASAILALTTGIYLVQPFVNDCDAPTSAVILIAITTLMSVTFINSTYVRYVVRVQAFFTALKFAALIFICVIGFIQIAKGETDVLKTGFEGSSTNPGSISVAMYSGVFTYGGWQFMYPLLEELKNPNRNVPLAIFLSFAAIIVIYLLTNIAYFSVLTPGEMFASEAVALAFADKTIGSYSFIMPMFVAVSTVGSLNGSFLGASRIFFAAARDHMFPQSMAMISVKYSTPITSVIITCILSIAYILTGSAILLLECLGFASIFNSLVTISIVIHQRFKHPEIERSIHIPIWLPITTAIILFVLMVFGFLQNPVPNSLGILLVMTGIPVYAVGVLWKNKPKAFMIIAAQIELTIQKILNVAAQENYDKGNHQGKCAAKGN